MPFGDYRPTTLARLRKNGDSDRFRSMLKSKDELLRLADSIADRSFRFGHIERLSIRGRTTFCWTNVADALVARCLKVNLAQTFGVRPSDRHTVLTNFLPVLTEECQKTIFRFDIRRFFESANRTSVMDRLERDPSVADVNVWLTRQYLDAAAQLGTSGLPRGLSPSAILAELLLRDVDNAIRRVQGVYYYDRYVDDGVVALSNSEDEAIDQIRGIIRSHALVLNREKSAKVKGTETCLEGELAFLGYRMSGTYKSSGFCRMSHARFKRLFRRVDLSFYRYSKDSNLGLLRSRLLFLTSNIRLEGRFRSGSICSGIYFSNRHLSEDDPEDLRLLDRHLRHVIFSPVAVHTRAATPLTRQQQRALAAISFSRGFLIKRFQRFPSSQLVEIRKAWR